MAPRLATAAVAIIKSITPKESFLILRRATHPLDPWSGHFSFPGGRKEIDDYDLLRTSIRETFEEVGLILTPAMMKTRLPVTPAGRGLKTPIMVQPFIFILEEQPPVTLNPAEVQGINWLDSEKFQNKKNHVQVELLPNQFFPAFPLADYYLWGFTYKLLKSVLEM